MRKQEENPVACSSLIFVLTYSVVDQLPFVVVGEEEFSLSSRARFTSRIGFSFARFVVVVLLLALETLC